MWGKGKRRADFYLNADLEFYSPLFFENRVCVRASFFLHFIERGGAATSAAPEKLLFFASLCLLSLQRRTSFPRKEIIKERGGE